VNPEEVIEVVALNVGCVGAAIKVVMSAREEDVLPPMFTAVTIAL
jgi:hypothetical protein